MPCILLASHREGTARWCQDELLCSGAVLAGVQRRRLLSALRLCMQPLGCGNGKKSLHASTTPSDLERLINGDSYRDCARHMKAELTLVSTQWYLLLWVLISYVSVSICFEIIAANQKALMFMSRVLTLRFNLRCNSHRLRQSCFRRLSDATTQQPAFDKRALVIS